MKQYIKPSSASMNFMYNEREVIPAIAAALAASPVVSAATVLAGAAGVAAGYKAVNAMMKKDIEALSYNSIPTLNPIIVKD